ncbi:MAG TPA: hypothetical protein EYG92_01710 [Lutibacter sp.]|nr:hypothetical protein [Lutibacter sp.]
MAIKKQSRNSNQIKTTEVAPQVKAFEKPVFSFFNMRNGKYHIDTCSQEQRSSLALKLSKIGQLSWQDLKTKATKSGLGYEFIDKKAIKGDSVDHLSEDIKLMAFRFWTQAPMVGYRCSNGAFHILWLDKDFTLYNHG